MIWFPNILYRLVPWRREKFDMVSNIIYHIQTRGLEFIAPVELYSYVQVQYLRQNDRTIFSRDAFRYPGTAVRGIPSRNC